MKRLSRVSLINRDKATRECPRITKFEERADPKRGRTNRDHSVCQPNAIPLGQSVSQESPAFGLARLGNAELSSKRLLRARRSQQVGDSECESYIQMGSDASHFNVSLIVRDNVRRQCPQTTISPTPYRYPPPSLPHNHTHPHSCFVATAY